MQLFFVKYNYYYNKEVISKLLKSRQRHNLRPAKGAFSPGWGLLFALVLNDF